MRMRRCVRACSNAAPSNVYSSRSARRRCLRRSTPHFEWVETCQDPRAPRGIDMNRARSSVEPQDKPIVFVVDDDVSVRESLELLIRFSGWQPELFASAEEFLARPRVLIPNCLILDVSLPDLNGLDLQKLIAVDRIDMPIIFITGYGDVPMTVQ